MLFTSGKSPHSHLAQSVFEFFISKYSIESDVEVFHTDLSDDNAFGFTEIDGDEQFIQIHDDLTEEDYITTLLHELVHVVQNENGQFDDDEREKEAYGLESILFNQFAAAN
jgi:Zn-dependent peptidase ImmA (M78 family)